MTLTYQLAQLRRACDKHLLYGLAFACLAVPCVLGLPGRGAVLGAGLFLALTARSVFALASDSRRRRAIEAKIKGQWFAKAQEADYAC